MKTYEIKQAIKLLKIPKRTIYRYNEKGFISFVNVEGVNKISQSDFNKLKRTKDAYSVIKVAEILGVSRWTVYKYEKDGKIKFTVINGKKRVTKEELQRFKEN